MPALRPSLEEVRSLSNLTQQFRWGIEIVKAPNIAPIDSYSVNLRAVSTTVPNANPTKTETIIRGHKIFENGIMDWVNTIDLTLVEAVDNIIARWIATWREGCWSRQGGVTGITQNKVDLEAIITLHRLDNKDQRIGSYTLHGVLLETTNYGELVAEAPDSIKPQLTLSYDYFIENQS